MAILLLGYVLGLKEKIKQVMRAFLVTISIFILTTARQSPTHAEDLTGDILSGAVADDVATTGTITTVADPLATTSIEIDNTSRVTHYLSKLLSLQDKRGKSDAFSSNNKKLYEAIWDQMKVTDPSEHLDLLKEIIASVKKTTSSDLKISAMILQEIYDMAQSDGTTTPATEDTGASDTGMANKLYTIEEIDYSGDAYQVITLKKPGTLKMATFHLSDGTTYSCIYAQCDKVIFNADSAPTSVYFTYGNGEESHINAFQKEVDDEDETEAAVDDEAVVDDEETEDTHAAADETSTDATTAEADTTSGALSDVEAELESMLGI